MQIKRLNVVDLFCGCGGLSLGFGLAGFNILLGIDNDQAAIKTFKKNHLESKAICNDINSITDEEIRGKLGPNNVDVIVGGPPCQGMSLSGPRKYEDPRNRLFLAYVRMAKLLKPSAFILENVPGLLSLYQGRLKTEIFREFYALGYNVKAQVLLAADFGVPQTRKRVFIVGTKRKKQKFIFPTPQYCQEENLFELLKYVTCEEAINDLPPLINDMGDEPSEYPMPPQNKFQKEMRIGSSLIWNHIGTNHSEKVKKIISLVPEGGNYKNLPVELRKTRNFNIAWTRYDGKKPASTIDTGHRHYFHYRYNRVPTVREHARLQSFPDSFIFFGNKSEQNRQVGNAVPPLLAKNIAEEIKKCL